MDGSSRARLLETFKSGRPCVLLGTSSFWEGVDVVGEALSCLIIARLPFAPPTDPIVEARSEQFDDPFNQYSLPHAILRFRQGFGRLIRSKTRPWHHDRAGQPSSDPPLRPLVPRLAPVVRDAGRPGHRRRTRRRRLDARRA